MENPCINIDTSGLCGSTEDILVWPDGIWCYRGDYRQDTSHHSDDVRVLWVATQDWFEFIHGEDL